MVYVDRLLQLFRYVPREQLTIPDFVFQLSFLVHFESLFLLLINPEWALFCTLIKENVQ